ncbi:MAG: hypothetical protein MK116_04225 [Phycisphaerales bacterium]|nr:hypothetical protein [Phycisphaerales bacterium]
MRSAIPSLLLIVSAHALGAGAVTRFIPHELPKLDLPGNIFTSPQAINDAGMVTGESGSSQVTIGMHAFSWSLGQPMLDLDEGSWPATAGLKINQAGTIAGDATFCPQQDGACASQPIVFLLDGTIVELEPVYTGYLVVTGINNNDQVIFNRVQTPGSSNISPRYWSPMDGTTILPLPGTAFSGYALDLNDSGQAVGYSVGGGYTAHIWTDGTISSLQVEPGGDAKAQAINNMGVIVGEADFDGTRHAVRWLNAQAAPEQLVTDPAAVRSTATTIEGDGTILGTWTDSDNRNLPFRIAPEGTVDLLTPPDHPGGTLELVPVGGTPGGWLVCLHMSSFYELQTAVWVPGEGWIFVNDRLVGPGSHTSQAPVDCNANGQIITRGAVWTTPTFLDPMPPGDVDGDKVVGINDILAVLAGYGQCPPHPSRLCEADVTADDQVDIDDILGVIDNWD